MKFIIMREYAPLAKIFSLFFAILNNLCQLGEKYAYFLPIGEKFASSQLSIIFWPIWQYFFFFWGGGSNRKIYTPSYRKDAWKQVKDHTVIFFFFRSWDIPVVVQTFDQVVNGVVKDRKTVVFIGKQVVYGVVKDRKTVIFIGKQVVNGIVKDRKTVVFIGKQLVNRGVPILSMLS